MRQVITRIALGSSGAILGYIGGSLLVNAEMFMAANGVEIGSDPSLMSELKAPAGLLLFVGAIMGAGSLRLRGANLGLVSGAVVYGSYGLSRLVSLLMDGAPSQSLIIAAVIELVISILLLGLQRRNRVFQSMRGNPNDL